MKTKSILLSAIALLAGHAFAYGPVGHEVIGAVADAKLAGRPAAAKIRALLDGATLAEAANLPDEIKRWDYSESAFHMPSHPVLEAQLHEFWRANPSTGNSDTLPSHHWFHYTDVPVADAEKYGDGKTGRSQWDLIHMMNFCVGVLDGTQPADNPRKITKPVAVVLLAHYVGDIHQPLHVGAEYFDRAGQPVNPDKGREGVADQGGNTITVNFPEPPGQPPRKTAQKLHGFWDSQAVTFALERVTDEIKKQSPAHPPEVTNEEIVHRFATIEPQGWRPPAQLPPKNYAQLWADEILPVAREAHERLRFERMHVSDSKGAPVVFGKAEEKPMPDHLAYTEWAGKVVEMELHKAGWRLAYLLDQVVK
jgi:hypothetical protein